MTLSKSSGKKCTRAFTLAEVVIAGAIMAVLVALMFAGVNQASASFRAAACSGNPRALGVGITAFVDDNHGFYPDTRLADWEPSDDKLPAKHRP